jgi:putative Mn2+ efflux pump MntP
VSAAFAAAEMGMPLLGLAAGSALGSRVGSGADYAAAGLLVVVGAAMLREQDEAGPAAAGVRGMRLAALALSVSIDELAIGFSLGLLGVPVLAAVLAIGLQALIAAQLGQRLGTRLGARFAEGAERLAGVALIALGAVFAALQLT